ncbi:patatin-like phospholipase family protein [Alistipes sp.]|uniref:patatin-like phospholipase family protein n=1 Tax=Alistipes sp. TaxID=1872444 RepID=UPI003AEF6E0B
MSKRKAALVLGGGGARGIAHIGVIEELESQGYEITAVAGTSMGALVGGMYAAGHLGAFKEWMCALDRYKVFSLVDFSLSSEGLVKGKRVIGAMKALVPDVRIEQMAIPFTAVAADLMTGREVVIDRGGLYDAIRASISIPSVFLPVHRGGMVLVDGGTVNPLPVNRVQRSAGDELVAVDVCAPFSQEPALRAKTSLNYYKMLISSSQIMQQHIAQLTCELHRPDVLVQLPADSFGIFEFYRAGEILEAGRAAARAVLAQREACAS